MTAPDSQPELGITVELVGGLGNQLFIYAAALASATRLECPLFFDVSLLEQPSSGETPRQLALDWLITPDQILPKVPRSGISRMKSAIARRLNIRESPSVFREHSFSYDSKFEDIKTGARMCGYFQSSRYFDAISQNLRHELLAEAPASEWLTTELARLNSYGNWTSLHIRRGDYTQSSNADHHGVLGIHYYRETINRAMLINPNTTFAIFSDEPSEARKLLSEIQAPLYFVNPPADAHPMESLVLLSHASTAIIANSSFSWWGAWLADPNHTPTFAPVPWFKAMNMPDADIYYPTWHQIPSYLHV